MSLEPDEVVDAEIVKEPDDLSDTRYDEATATKPYVVPQARERFDEHEPGQDLVVTPGALDVMRPLDSAQLVESFREYQALRGQLLTADDYQDAGRGKKFVKKSGWRKIATAFGLNVSLLRSDIERDEDGQPTRAAVVARAIAPNGRFSDGDGYCDVSEERFSGPRGNKSKLENDLRATATTRAKNRAISDLVGMGEVSAEEVDGSGERSEWGAEATEQQIVGARNAIGFLLMKAGLKPDDANAEAGLAVEKWKSAYGYVPGGSAGAIILLAKQVQAMGATPETEKEEATSGDS